MEIEYNILCIFCFVINHEKEKEVLKSRNSRGRSRGRPLVKNKICILKSYFDRLITKISNVIMFCTELDGLEGEDCV